MGEDRSKNANPFGVGFLPKRSSEETRGRSIDPGNGFPSPKNSVHFRVTGAGEEQDVSVSTKTFSLLGLSVCNVRLISDVQQPQESSPPAVPFSSSLYWESTVPPTSTKALHTHTITMCHMAYSRTAFFLKSRGITATNYCLIKLHPALLSCLLWYLTAGKSVRTGHAAM